MDNQELTYLNTLAISCLATGLVDEAQPAFEMIAEVDPKNTAGPVGLASIELAKGNYDSACQILQDASAESRVSRSQAQKILMSALVASNRLDEAEDLRSSLTKVDAANDDYEYLRQSHRFFGTGDPRMLGN
jgi:Flp pilus assembly protein TadD